MTVDPFDFPIVPLAGSESWTYAYERADVWEKMFPGQDADQLSYAITYNGLAEGKDECSLVSLKCIQFGENDGSEWIWEVEFSDSSKWTATGWCDYTGWDCQSGLDWQQI